MIHPDVQTDKFPKDGRVLQRFLHRRVRQAKPLFHEVDTQQGPNGKRKAPAIRAGRCCVRRKIVTNLAQGTTCSICVRNAGGVCV